MRMCACVRACIRACMRACVCLYVCLCSSASPSVLERQTPTSKAAFPSYRRHDASRCVCARRPSAPGGERGGGGRVWRVLVCLFSPNTRRQLVCSLRGRRHVSFRNSGLANFPLQGTLRNGTANGQSGHATVSYGQLRSAGQSVHPHRARAVWDPGDLETRCPGFAPMTLQCPGDPM